MNNYIMFKEIPGKGAYISFNTITKFIDKEAGNYQDLRDIAVEFNGTRDLTLRETLTKKFEETLMGKFYTTLKENPNYTLDQFGDLFLNGISKPIPKLVAKFLKKAIKEGIDLTPYENFWRNLFLNPDETVVEQLYGFLENNGHPITTSGYFLAYKAVQVKQKFDKTTGKLIETKIYDENTGKEVKQVVNTGMEFTPIHTGGSYGNDITIGKPVAMPREKCDSNPNRTCSAGLHVGSMAYVKDFGYSQSVILEVLVNPKNVVAVPTDYNNTKMRTCEYFPIGLSNGQNDAIFLEEDYMAYDLEKTKEEILALETKQKEALAQLEKELEEKKKILGIL